MTWTEKKMNKRAGTHVRGGRANHGSSSRTQVVVPDASIKHSNEDYAYGVKRLSRLDSYNDNLTDWEVEFIRSLRKWLSNGKFLSPKQGVFLYRIWVKIYQGSPMKAPESAAPTA